MIHEPLWYRLPAALLHMDISLASTVLLTVILDQSDRTGCCTATLADLAQATGVNRRTVMRAITELEEMQLLTVQRSTGECSTYTPAAEILPPKQRKGSAPAAASAPAPTAPRPTRQRQQRRSEWSGTGTSYEDGTASFDIADFEKMVNQF